MGSSRLSQSTTNNSINKRHSKVSSQILTNEFKDDDNSKDYYEDFILTKKEKNINLNKIYILKNRINNLKQQEKKNIRQIEILQEKEEKMKKIINEKNENKKKIEEHKKKEKERFILMKKKIQEERQIQINNLNNSLIKRKEDLNKKINILKKDKKDIKNKINNNNNTVLNINKLKYEKAKTCLIFNKDKNIIIKAEKEEEKRLNRLKMMNKEKKQNLVLEKNIEILEKEEEKYLDLIKQTHLIKQKLNQNSFHSNQMSKLFIQKENSKKKKLIRLQTNEIKKMNNCCLRTFHKSIDINDNNKLYKNEDSNYNYSNSFIINKTCSKSCSNRKNRICNISYEKKIKKIIFTKKKD